MQHQHRCHHHWIWALNRAGCAEDWVYYNYYAPMISRVCVLVRGPRFTSRVLSVSRNASFWTPFLAKFITVKLWKMIFFLRPHLLSSWVIDLAFPQEMRGKKVHFLFVSCTSLWSNGRSSFGKCFAIRTLRDFPNFLLWLARIYNGIWVCRGNGMGWDYFFVRCRTQVILKPLQFVTVYTSTLETTPPKKCSSLTPISIIRCGVWVGKCAKISESSS